VTSKPKTEEVVYLTQLAKSGGAGQRGKAFDFTGAALHVWRQVVGYTQGSCPRGIVSVKPLLYSSNLGLRSVVVTGVPYAGAVNPRISRRIKA
jgi:hypothetical protein